MRGLVWSEPVNDNIPYIHWTALYDPTNSKTILDLPVAGVRFNTETNTWEVGLVAVPSWEPLPSVRNLDEAKATALALYRMR